MTKLFDPSFNRTSLVDGFTDDAMNIATKLQYPQNLRAEFILTTTNVRSAVAPIITLLRTSCFELAGRAAVLDKPYVQAVTLALKKACELPVREDPRASNLVIISSVVKDRVEYRVNLILSEPESDPRGDNIGAAIAGWEVLLKAFPF